MCIFRSLVVLQTLVVLTAVQAPVCWSAPQATDGSGPTAKGDQNHERTDAWGDPLPQNALLRLGSARWRGEALLDFAAERRGAVTLRGTTVHTRDIPDGKISRKFNLPPGTRNACLSPDGKTLATFSPDGTIRFWDAVKGEELRTAKIDVAKEPAFKMQNAGMRLSPDGGLLAIKAWEDRILLLFDVKTGKQLHRLNLNEGNAQEKKEAQIFGVTDDFRSNLVFSQDGSHLGTQRALSKENDDTYHYQLLVWNTKTGKLESTYSAPGLVHCFTLTSNGKSLAYADDTHVVFVDSATAKKSGAFELTQEIFELAFSPDGKTIAGRGHAPHYLIHLWDENGKNYRVLGQAAQPEKTVGPAIILPGTNLWVCLGTMRFSQDSKLLADGKRNLRVWELASAKDLLADSGHQRAIATMAMTKDGKHAVTVGHDFTARVWDAVTGKELRRFDFPRSTQCMALSPDARWLALGSSDGKVTVIDVATGKKSQEFKDHKEAITGLSFDGRGERLAGKDARAIRVWDITAGKIVRNIDVDVQENQARGGFMIELVSPTRMLTDIVLSPDARHIVLAHWNKECQIIHVGTKRVLHRFPAPKNPNADGLQFEGMQVKGSAERIFAVSSDDRLIAFNDGPNSVVIAEMATGAIRARLIPNKPIRALAFSPDARFLACGHTYNTVSLWDVYAGKQMTSFNGQDARVPTDRGACEAALAFSRDGKRLLSSGSDTTSVLWDIAAVRPTVLPAASAAEVQAAWTELAGDDGAKIHAAIARLIASGDEAVAVVASHLKPVAVPTQEQIDELVRKLDSDNFETRSQATKALERIGRAAIPALEASLREEKTALESRRRLERLLDSLRTESAAGGEVQALRCLEVLERVATRDAKAILESLSRGSAEALVTTTAAASLQRTR